MKQLSVALLFVVMSTSFAHPIFDLGGLFHHHDYHSHRSPYHVHRYPISYHPVDVEYHHPSHHADYYETYSPDYYIVKQPVVGHGTAYANAQASTGGNGGLAYNPYHAGTGSYAKAEATSYGKK